MKIIGLTGSFGTGKSYVASIFKSLGAAVIDADLIAHDVIKKRTAEYKRIVKLCGRGILDKSGEMSRKKLGKIVFSDKALLRKLNDIVHPEVIKRMKSAIIEVEKKLTVKDVVVIDAPLLIEAKLDKLADKLVVVKCSKRRQVERCQEKFRLQKEEILLRVKSQISLEKKSKMADFVINNSGTRSSTINQVIKVWEEILWR